jgi:hypothetical protein
MSDTRIFGLHFSHSELYRKVPAFEGCPNEVLFPYESKPPKTPDEWEGYDCSFAHEDLGVFDESMLNYRIFKSEYGRLRLGILTGAFTPLPVMERRRDKLKTFLEPFGLWHPNRLALWPVPDDVPEHGTSNGQDKTT